MYRKYKRRLKTQKEFFQDILSNMTDWVRVVDKENKVLFINEPMKKSLGDIVGKECYRALNKTSPCKNCISNIGICKGTSFTKEEIVDGKIYSVVSSPVWDEEKKTYCAVEVFRDVTEQKKMEELIISQNQKMKKDLEFAKRLQLRLLPNDGEYNGLKIASKYTPSEHLGGDLFDVVEIDEENTGVYIADVSGHGVTSSMMTMFIKQTIKNLCESAVDPAYTLKNLYGQYQELGIESAYYITIFYGVYNKKNKTFKYANAGHNCLPVLISEDKIKELEISGIPICRLFEEVDYEQDIIELKKGDKILLYTDGISEAVHPKKGFFTNERVLKICQENKKKNVGILVYKLLRKVKEYTNNQIKDDIAMIAMEVL
ncbi:PP2C family protein-serine/threonine phosphatase [Anaeromicrobium sediminis]|uniref:PPM-type phosphatase domain-containing protein n=1 Tax=Anaeromicrobium sediminis TaxID=1478221 RepID=A0A267MFV3_9FIRM|nr:PP2C family protein-serine/threonine phosphatase [Anaeromicrobium sediminis]PAB58464.1 hypothetical protein CCE28_15265 [Anaeromicrobium sediminis]